MRQGRRPLSVLSIYVLQDELTHGTEIDHNFSKAHRIVTTSILPVVEQYGENSKNVWEASKFWKQFFEASANVSLSGYEELANDDEDEDDTTRAEEASTVQEGDSTANFTAQGPEGDGYDGETLNTGVGGQAATFQGDESILDDGELTGSTPRVPATKTLQANFSHHESPYEALKRELKGEAPAPYAEDDDDDDDDEGGMGAEEEEDSTILFAQQTARLPDMSMMPHLPKAQRSPERGTGTAHKDPLLHRILDKNYRLQATPHKGPMLRISPLKTDDERGRSKGKQRDEEEEKEDVPRWRDDSPMSSPVMEAPKLRSEAFMSPVKTMQRQRLAARGEQGPRTPGVSVQTPATARKTRDVFAEEGEAARAGGTTTEGKRPKYEIDWESDSDGEGDGAFEGMSPPKTIQFALPPSKLLQTPGMFTRPYPPFPS